MSDTLESGPVWLKWTGLFVGPVAGVAVYWLLLGSSLSAEGRATLAVGALMAVWWLSEAISLEATALLPLALFPILGVAPFKAAAAPYADEVIFLFMGGMMLGIALERWELHRRLALWTMLAGGHAAGDAHRRDDAGDRGAQHVGEQHGDGGDDAADRGERGGAGAREIRGGR
jgi:hypothetical protein